MRQAVQRATRGKCRAGGGGGLLYVCRLTVARHPLQEQPDSEGGRLKLNFQQPAAASTSAVRNEDERGS